MTDTQVSEQKKQQENVFSAQKNAEGQENVFSAEKAVEGQEEQADGTFTAKKEKLEEPEKGNFNYGDAISLGGDTNAADFFINQIFTLNLFSQILPRVKSNIELFVRVADDVNEAINDFRNFRNRRQANKEKQELQKLLNQKPENGQQSKAGSNDRSGKKGKQEERKATNNNKKKKNIKQIGLENKERKYQKEQMEKTALRKSTKRAGFKQRVSDLKGLKKSIAMMNNRSQNRTRTNQNTAARVSASRKERD